MFSTPPDIARQKIIFIIAILLTVRGGVHHTDEPGTFLGLRRGSPHCEGILHDGEEGGGGGGFPGGGGGMPALEWLALLTG